MTRAHWNAALTGLRTSIDSLSYDRDCEGDTEALCVVAERLAALAPASELSACLHNAIADVRHGIAVNLEEARRAA